MVRHVLEFVWVPVSGTYPGLIKLLPSVPHASRWQANAANRKQRAPGQKRDKHSFRGKGADCRFAWKGYVFGYISTNVAMSKQPSVFIGSTSYNTNLQAKRVVEAQNMLRGIRA